jgi:hypothetical protein
MSQYGGSVYRAGPPDSFSQTLANNGVSGVFCWAVSLPGMRSATVIAKAFSAGFPAADRGGRRGARASPTPVPGTCDV